jgi:hypothetical protein
MPDATLGIQIAEGRCTAVKATNCAADKFIFLYIPVHVGLAPAKMSQKSSLGCWPLLEAGRRAIDGMSPLTSAVSRRECLFAACTAEKKLLKLTSQLQHDSHEQKGILYASGFVMSHDDTYVCSCDVLISLAAVTTNVHIVLCGAHMLAAQGEAAKLAWLVSCRCRLASDRTSMAKATEPSPGR